MKIGLVRRGFSPTGGAEAYLRRFAQAAAAAGHPCVLFAPEAWPQSAWPQGAAHGDRPQEAAHGDRPQIVPPIVRVGGAASPMAFADALEALKPHRHCDFLFSLERVWRCDAYRAGDGVHAVWMERRALGESWLRRVSRSLFNRKHAALLALEQSLFSEKGAGRVIANSAMVQREIVERYGYPVNNIHVVHNGLPPLVAPPDSRAEVRRELGLSESEYLLLFVGSGWERKGLRYAIEAVEAAPCAVTLIVAGRGNPGKMLASKRTRFLGPRSDIARLLAAADAFILPTLYEPFSNACLEALAAGLPVITTAFNGFAEIIEPGLEGEIVENPADIGALSEAIARWAEAEKRRSLKGRLVEKGARFSIERNVEETLAWLEK